MSGLERYFGLHGKVALVTGSTRGIGLATVEAFAAAGAAVIVSSDERAACRDVAARLSSTGARVIDLPCDVRDPKALADLVAEAETTVGPVDILVCNAGISPHLGPIGEASDAVIAEMFDVNLMHPLRLTSLVAPGMAARGAGSIILMSSLAGLRGNKAIGLYALTKAALVQLARNLAVEWGPRGVRANAIAPGLIETGWTSAILSDRTARDRRLGLTPMRRTGQPFEVAATALFLAGPGGGFVSGHTLVVDGGSLITDGN